MKRRTFLSAVIIGSAGNIVIAKSKPANVTCSVDLPNHVLEYSLPEEVARQMSARMVDTHFDASEPFERGFRRITGTMVDFGGSFFTGPSGTFTFHVLVIERSAEYTGDISSAEGLKEYVSWWVPIRLRSEREHLGIVSINGTEAVSRGLGTPLEILSFPLDQKMFLEFGLLIRWLRAGANAPWVKKAEAMRDSIRASIRLRPKS